MLKVPYNKCKITVFNSSAVQVWNSSVQNPYTILLHTPHSRGLPEKLTYPQLIKKFLAFYETRRFITAFKTAYHLSLP
jgi:hypothetical protein